MPSTREVKAFGATLDCTLERARHLLNRSLPTVRFQPKREEVPVETLPEESNGEPSAGATWFVYILRCDDGTLYTGITNNLPRRCAQHNAGKASRYTRSRLPVEVAYQETQASRSEALKRELAIKRLTRQKKEALVRSARDVRAGFNSDLAVASDTKGNDMTIKQSESSHPASIDEYIAGFAPDLQSILNKIRATIKSEAPAAEEIISYRMPAFRLHGILVYFAMFKKHIGLYPPVSGDTAIEKAIAPYAGPKGNLKFPLDQPIPFKLIRRIVKLRIKQNLAKAKANQQKRTTPKNARILVDRPPHDATPC